MSTCRIYHAARCAGEKKISCTVYDCFVHARVLKSYYAEKS